MDYLLPTTDTVPDIEIGHVESPSAGPGGYKGVGEGGAIGASPAVVNAVADALAPFGVEVTSLPLSPATIIEDARRGPGGEGMKPSAFDYHAPGTAADAVALIAELGDEAKFIAGGQSLMPMLNLRLAVFDHLVDLRKPAELRGIEQRGDSMWIGAGTTHSTVGRSAEIATAVPLLSRATPFIGHFQIRNRGTLGGSIAHADAAAEYPAVALALDADIEALSPRGSRTIPASEFFTGMWTTDLEADELLTGVSFPTWSGRSGFAIEEFARRTGDFALAGAARRDPSRCRINTRPMRDHAVRCGSDARPRHRGRVGTPRPEHPRDRRRRDRTKRTRFARHGLGRPARPRRLPPASRSDDHSTCVATRGG